APGRPAAGYDCLVNRVLRRPLRAAANLGAWRLRHQGASMSGLPPWISVDALLTAITTLGAKVFIERSTDGLRLLYKHDRDGALKVVAALETAGISNEDIRAALRDEPSSPAASSQLEGKPELEQG